MDPLFDEILFEHHHPYWAQTLIKKNEQQNYY